MMSIFKNKKADASVTILVLLTVALCVACLFYFYVSEKNRETEIVTFGTINDFYVQADGMKYFIQSLAEDIVHNNLNINNETFLYEFKKNFAISYWNMEPGMVKQIRLSDYDVKIKDKVLYFSIKNFTISKNYQQKAGGIYRVDYEKDLFFTIPIK